MSKILVVSYSYTGTCSRLARMLAEFQQWPRGEIRDVRPRHGATGYVRSLLDSWGRRHPEIYYDGPDPAGFDALVLVSPIWAWQLAGPMRSFVTAHAPDLHDVAVVSVMGASGAPNAVAEVRNILGKPLLTVAAFTTRDVDSGRCAARLQALGKTIQAAEEAPVVNPPVRLTPRAA